MLSDEIYCNFRNILTSEIINKTTQNLGKIKVLKKIKSLFKKEDKRRKYTTWDEAVYAIISIIRKKGLKKSDLKLIHFIETLSYYPIDMHLSYWI